MCVVCVKERRERFYGPLAHDHVMIVPEFLPNGDLREFLNSLKSRYEMYTP